MSIKSSSRRPVSYGGMSRTCELAWDKWMKGDERRSSSSSSYHIAIVCISLPLSLPSLMVRTSPWMSPHLLRRDEKWFMKKIINCYQKFSAKHVKLHSVVGWKLKAKLVRDRTNHPSVMMNFSTIHMSSPFAMPLSTLNRILMVSTVSNIMRETMNFHQHAIFKMVLAAMLRWWWNCLCALTFVIFHCISSGWDCRIAFCELVEGDNGYCRDELAFCWIGGARRRGRVHGRMTFDGE